MPDHEKIPQPDMSMVNCDYNQCSRYGEYIECYFDFMACIHYAQYMRKLANGGIQGGWDLDDNG